MARSQPVQQDDIFGYIPRAGYTTGPTAHPETFLGGSLRLPDETACLAASLVPLGGWGASMSVCTPQNRGSQPGMMRVEGNKETRAVAGSMPMFTNTRHVGNTTVQHYGRVTRKA
jgi:hypothetical protein